MEGKSFSLISMMETTHCQINAAAKTVMLLLGSERRATNLNQIHTQSSRSHTAHRYAFMFRWINALAKETNEKKHCICWLLNYGLQFSEVTEREWCTARSDSYIVFILSLHTNILYFPRFNIFAHHTSTDYFGTLSKACSGTALHWGVEMSNAVTILYHDHIKDKYKAMTQKNMTKTPIQTHIQFWSYKL